MKRLNAEATSIYWRKNWVRGHLLVENGLIVGIDGYESPPTPPFIVPGFVDLHVHGGGGSDVMGDGDIATIGRFHARHGTVAFCPTTLTAPPSDIDFALKAISNSMATSDSVVPEVLGAHLEGPYISSEKLGGQPPFSENPDLAQLRGWLSICKVNIVTLAPELPGSESAIRFLADQGIRVQIGHSLATVDQVISARGWGASGFAHLFNAAAPITARFPGVIGAALTDGEWAELICDLKHVHPALLRLAIKSIDGAYSVTDCCAAGGMPDGHFMLGRNAVDKRDGLVYLHGSSQPAASVLTCDIAFRNIVSLGFPIELAISMTSERPASYLNRTDYGRVEPGCWASVVELDDNLTVNSVWLKGRRIDDD